MPQLLNMGYFHVFEGITCHPMQMLKASLKVKQPLMYTAYLCSHAQQASDHLLRREA